MGAVKSAMRDADSVVALVDVTKDREDMLAMLQPPKGKERPPMLVALNKIDLLKQAETKEAVVCSCSHPWSLAPRELMIAVHPMECVIQHGQRVDQHGLRMLTRLVQEHIHTERKELRA